MIKLAVLNDTGWVEPQFINGWENYLGDYYPVAYRKINNVVYLRGMAKNGTNSTIFTLPNDSIPSKDLMFAINSCNNSNQVFRVNITRSGDVLLVGVYNNEWVSLNGISFMLD